LIDIDLWDRGKAAVDEKALEHKRAFGGLDLALVSDLSALVLAFPEGERIQTLARYWCPEDDITERSTRDQVPYDIWRARGLIEMTPGNVTDFGYIAREIVQLAARYDIIEIAYDRTFAGELVQRLTDEGITMVPFGQGFLSMGPAVAELLRLVKGERIQHGGHEILRWNVSNAQALSDAAKNLKIDKSDPKERVDGIVALAMAVGRLHAYHEGPASGPSMLETRGPLVVRAE
jgi:phage terminase large subunit-like protein